EYIAPELEPIQKGYADIQAMVEGGTATAQEVIDAYEKVFEDHLFFRTMHTLADIRYNLNLSDTYFEDEYNRCEELSPLLSQAQEKCFVAMSESPLRDELEELYFEEDFFVFYDNEQNRVYSKDRTVELMQEASAIESEYMALQDSPTIMWKGKETAMDTLLEDDSLPYEEYLQVYRAYYDKYTPLVADLYAKTIRIRKELAKELGYASYAEYAYAYEYDRDYSPEDVAAYCDAIADELPSLLFSAIYAQDGSLPNMDMEGCKDLFRSTVQGFGGVIQTTYEFMVDYELWDTEASSSKFPASYTTYLDSYEMPFFSVNPSGGLSDYMTLCHEFGHFVDGYVNCGGSSSIDCAEIFSQGLEYLSLTRGDLNPKDRNKLIRSTAADAVMVFLSQACYADFEALAYELPDEKLNAEGLNELYLEVNRKYGMSMLYMGMEDLLAPGWIDVPHFFIAPYYVISYCISNDAALQIYQQDMAEDKGLELYYELLALPRDYTILELAEASGLQSPFAEGRIKDLADFLDDQIN
ncbi:MAG: hypothetical protein IKM59_01255, partial [Oscillospiraceae bacterium]|nr:hypothetical protein [Oscillospiraceae bacterium]